MRGQPARAGVGKTLVAVAEKGPASPTKTAALVVVAPRAYDLYGLDDPV